MHLSMYTYWHFFTVLLLFVPATSQCSDEEFRVATYNILYSNCGGYYDFCECASSSPARYAADTIQPDVLGTQENGCQVDFGSDMGAPYQVVPYDCQSCNHNAIYFNSDRIRYGGASGVENTEHRDHYSIRMYSWARMETQTGFAFWIFNVHNPHEHGNPYGFQANIAEQMINKYHEVSNGEPAVFTGDFNPHKDNNQWQRYAEENGLTKAGESSGGVCGFCDQIYFTNGDFEVVSRQVHGSGGSDHNAYSVVLRPSQCGGDHNSPAIPPTQVTDVKVVEWVGKDGCNQWSPCEDAKSDCDSDIDCAGDLICWQRSNGETKSGYDVTSINSDADVCIQPEALATAGPDSDEPTDDTPDVDPSGTPIKVITFVGKDSCTPQTPCQDAESDCDQDADCEGGLVCWQRTSGESRDGYDASQIRDDADACVQPQSTTSSEPPMTESMSDEFSGSSVDQSKWTVVRMNAAWKNEEKQCYVQQNTAVREGNLVLTAGRRTGAPWENLDCGVQQYFSGSIESKTYFLHGTMEVRAKLPSGDGLWPAIWLLGHGETWPACGEIDIMEVANKDPVGSQATLHYGPPRGNSINLGFGRTPSIPLKNEFHTWKIERSSDLIVMYFDGEEFGRKTRQEILDTNYPNAAKIFDAPMRLILNVAVGGGFTGIGNRPPNMDTWDKPTMEVDYVRTWADESGTCLDKVVCGRDSCASCRDRIDWLMTTQGKSETEAKNQVESEFPNDCVCDSENALMSLFDTSFQSSDENSLPENSNETEFGWLPLLLGVLGGLFFLVFAAYAMYCRTCCKADYLCGSCEMPFLDTNSSHETESKVQPKLEVIL